MRESTKSSRLARAVDRAIRPFLNFIRAGQPSRAQVPAEYNLKSLEPRYHINGPLDAAGLMAFLIPGTHTFQINSGSYSINYDIAAATGISNASLSIAGGASVTFTSDEHLAALSVDGNGSIVEFSPGYALGVDGALGITGGGAVRLDPTGAADNGLIDRLGSLAIGGASSLDLGNNTLLIQNAANESTIAGYLANGYNGDWWNGTTTSTSATGGSIISITAYNDGTGLTSVGYGNAADFTFSGSTSPTPPAASTPSAATR